MKNLVEGIMLLVGMSICFYFSVPTIDYIMKFGLSEALSIIIYFLACIGVGLIFYYLVFDGFKDKVTK